MSEKETNDKQPSNGKIPIFLILINILQFGLIIYLWSEIDNHEHYFDYEFADEDHIHSATDITYESFAYGGYGTLQAEIEVLKNDYAKKRHTHSEYARNWHLH